MRESHPMNVLPWHFLVLSDRIRYPLFISSRNVPGTKPLRLACLIIGVLFCHCVLPAATWQWLNPLPAGAISTVTRLNSQFFFCAGPKILTSLDGTNWVTRAVNGQVGFNCVGFGNGLYVAAGFGGEIQTSTNLNDWTTQSSGTASDLYAIAYGNGMFVVVGNGGTILTSTNGVQWTPRSSPTARRLSSIAYGNGIFVACTFSTTPGFGDDAGGYVSSDGVTWTRYTIVAGAGTVMDVNFSGGWFHAAGSKYNTILVTTFHDSLSISTDGTNWSSATFSGDSAGMGSLFATDTACYVVRGGVRGGVPSLMISTDQTNFFDIPSTNFPGVDLPATYAGGNGTFISLASGINLSPDATNWSAYNGGPTPALNDIAVGNGAVVAVGAGGAVLLSFGGGPFTVQSSPVGVALNRVVFADGLFHAVGNGGTVLRSTNGIVWVQRNSSAVNNLTRLCRANGLWVAVGDAGTIVTSPNGQAWTTRFSGTSQGLSGVAYGGGTFVAVGSQGTALTSPDAITWTAQFANTLESFFDVVYDGAQFIAVGSNGAIWTSPDGQNWSSVVSGTSATLSAIAYSSGSYIAAGNVLISSTDGVNWSAERPGTFSALHGARGYGRSFYVVGDAGTVLESASPDSILLSASPKAIQGQFQGSVSGGLGLSFKLQSTDSLTSPSWVDRTNFVNAPSPVYFTDPAVATQLMRYYRVVGP